MSIPKIYSVTELNTQVRNLLEDCYGEVWLEGEIGNFSRPSSGHWYFTLKDKTAQISCAMFRMQNRKVDFTPSEGTQVLIKAKMSLYVERGNYQLICNSMEEAGDGVLKKEFEKLKLKLEKEGLFKPEYKKTLPKLPNKIGIITSPTGAALHDILSVLKRRFPSIPVVIYPTAVQGTEATQQIIESIQTADNRSECDVLILGRGGGSLEDLWCFNEEAVARTIFDCSIPIISAVGHEIDFSISDYVADQRAATPSAAAELISPDIKNIIDNLNNMFRNLSQIITYNLTTKNHGLIQLKNQLKHPGQTIQDQFQKIDELERRLLQTINNLLEKNKNNLISQTKLLNSISPLAVLDRGFSLILDEKDNLLSDISTIEPEQKIKIKFKNGLAESKIVKILAS